MGVIVGALLAGGFSVSSTFLQQQGDAERSRADYLREQRLQIYSEYIANLEKLRDAEIRVVSIFSSRTGDISADAAYRTANEALTSARSTVDLNQAKVSLICSQPICPLSTVVRGEHFLISSTFLRGSFGSMSSEEVKKRYDEISARAQKMEFEMVRAMQKELGVTQ